ncbi:MAG: hypothetical protein ACN6PJ_02515 [Achromobacter sp.]|uniref:hypothetical protein n=1 Tax=Achromobacter sp. TaxID=134375 RepID=UPI003CFBC8F7
MSTDTKHDTGRQQPEQPASRSRANTPQPDTETARRSGQFGADKPGFGKPPRRPERAADRKPNDKGPEYEEGGQYPGKRPDGK